MKLSLLHASLGCAAALLAGCWAPPKQDAFKSEGGLSPDPMGRMTGSIVYVGPRPSCDYEDTKPVRVRGRVVLTMFAYDNPPPPEGNATTALNLAFVNGSELFSTEDCLPQGAAANPADVITRVAPLLWPEIPLGTEEAHYQVRGYYDSDEDMIALFSVTNLPTAGDIAGGAVVDLNDPSKGLLDIVMPPVSRARNGFEREGVVVALGNYIWMERPVFEPSAQHRFLSAENPIAVAMNETFTAVDPVGTLRATWASTCESGASTPDCGFRLQQLDEGQTRANLEAGEVELDFSPERYAFVSEPVDVATLRKGAADLRQPDGLPDPHPLLGALAGVPWVTPIVILSRSAPTPAMQAVEAKAGIPNVRLIGSPLLDETGRAAIRRQHLGDIEIAVPSIAAVELSANPLCRVPYIAPGNFTTAYESQLAYCAELPTGIFGINAIQGVAGGVKVSDENSDTGSGFSGGILASQVWSVPNELGNPAQIGERVLPSQGVSQLFVVHDPRPEVTGSCEEAYDPVAGLRAVVKRGLCGADEALGLENPLDPLGVDMQGCLPTDCCAEVRHLCGVPLCEVCTEASCPGLGLGGRTIRQGPTEITRVESGKSIPNCVPFEVPDFCCE